MSTEIYFIWLFGWSVQTEYLCIPEHTILLLWFPKGWDSRRRTPQLTWVQRFWICFLPTIDYESSVNHFNFFYSKHWILTILLKYSLENYIFCEILSEEGCLPASVFKDYAGRVSKLHVPCAFLIQLSHQIGNGLSLTLTAHLIDLALSGILPSCVDERNFLFGSHSASQWMSLLLTYVTSLGSNQPCSRICLVCFLCRQWVMDYWRWG